MGWLLAICGLITLKTPAIFLSEVWIIESILDMLSLPRLPPPAVGNSSWFDKLAMK